MDKKSVNNKKRKRLQNKSDLDKRLQQQKQDYYDRLFYKCQKELHKQAKIAKSFECQKIIRKVKELKKTLEKDENDEHAAKQLEKNEAKLKEMKDMSLEPVIQEAMRRLGITNLNPSLYLKNDDYDESKEKKKSNKDGNDSNDDENQEMDDDEGSKSSSSSSSSSIQRRDNLEDEEDNKNSGLEQTQEESQEESNNIEHNREGSRTKADGASETLRRMKERILRHKRLQSALESWNDEVTEYRRWCLRQEERSESGPKEKNSDGKKNKKKRTVHDSYEKTIAAKDLTGSLFLQLGDQSSGAISNNNYASAANSYYGPAGGEKKKNRPGQRERRAKAMALEAKKEGRIIDNSINWRAPRARNDYDNKGHNHNSPYQERGASAPKQNKSEEELHPSWQARKSQKEGIVPFQGKKITFD